MYKETYSRQELRDIIAGEIRGYRQRCQEYRPSEFYKNRAEFFAGGAASLRELAQDLGLFDKRPTSLRRAQSSAGGGNKDKP